MKAPHTLPDPAGGFLGTRRRPPVTATRVPAPPEPTPVSAPASQAHGKAPSGRSPPPAAPAPARPAPAARKAPSRGSSGQVVPAPVPAVVPVASPDALLTRYAAVIGHDPPQAGALRALLHGLLTEHAEVIAQALENAAFVNAAEPLHRDAAPPLSHAAMIVRAEFGVRPMR